VDSSGNIYVVWVDNTPGHFDVFFSRSTDRGATFSAAQNISNNPGGTSGPQIAVDSSGNIDVVWSGNTPNADIFFSRSTDGGASFSAPQNISNNAGNSTGPLMAVDSAGNINVTWADTTPGRADVFFSRSINGGAAFSQPQNLTPSNAGPWHSIPVQIAVDSAGNINILFHFFGGTDSSIKFMRSSDGGSTFSAPQQMTGSSEENHEVRMALDPSGSINFVIEDGSVAGTVYFMRTTDGGVSFSPQIVLSSSDSARTPQITVDSFGGINIVWQANFVDSSNPGGIAFTHSTDNGASFSPLQVLSSRDFSATGEQLAVDPNGNINVVWQSRASGKSQILFSRSSDGGATFSFPQNLSNDSGNATTPLPAVDSAGNVNVIWMDDTPGNLDIFFSRSVPSGSLSSLALNSVSVTGGNSVTGTVTLVSPAPAGGAAVALQSSNWSVASVPDPVIVPAGATTANFIVSTGSVPESTSVTVSASYQGVTRAVNLTVSP